MKTLYVGFILLCTLTIVCAATGDPSADPKATQTTQENGSSSDGQVSAPATEDGQSSTIMSRAEADSLRVQGDRLTARSDVGEIQVGSIAGNDLIYVLVVVLLVVVILAVAL